MAEQGGCLTGAKIDIPAHDDGKAPYRVTAETAFDASISWIDKIEDDGFGVDLVTTWRELPADFEETHHLGLDNDDAVIYVHRGPWIVVIRNKDGLYQSRRGEIVSVSKGGSDQSATRALADKVFA